MKLSLWQQWASNHSASFAIVGEFEDAETARQVADELRAIFAGLRKWHDDNPRESDHVYRTGEPGEFERQIATKYGLTLEHALDWWYAALVEVAGIHVAIGHSSDQTSSHGEPIAEYLTKRGARVFHEKQYGDDERELRLELRCSAPDEPTAIALYEKHLGYFQRVHREGLHLTFKYWKPRSDADETFVSLINDVTVHKCTNVSFRFIELDQKRSAYQWEVADETLLRELLRLQRDAYFAVYDMEKLGRVDLLIEALSLPSSKWRVSASHRLAKVADATAVPALIGLLDDPDTQVQDAALYALEAIPTPAVVQSLLARLTDPQLGNRVMLHLGRIGQTTLDALKSMPGSLSTSTDRLQQTIALAQETVAGGDALSSLRGRNPQPIAELIREGRIDVLVSYLHNPGRSGLDQQVFDALVKTGDPGVLPELASAIRQGRNLHQIEKLEQFGPAALPHLYSIATDAGLHIYLRFAAALSLYRLGDERAGPLTKDLLKAAPPGVKLEPIRNLLKADFPDAGELALAEFWAVWESADRSESTMEGLAYHMRPIVSPVIRPLVAALSSGDPDFVLIVRVLHQIGNPRAIEPLKRALKKAEGWNRELLLDVLQRLEYPEEPIQ